MKRRIVLFTFVSFVVSCGATISAFAQSQQDHERQQQRDMADFLKADREQTEKYVRERDQQRERQQQRDMADFLKADREQTERYVRERDQEQERQQTERSNKQIVTFLSDDRAQVYGSRNVERGNEAPTETPMGDYPFSSSTILSYLSLPNGERISLPERNYWQGRGEISVTMQDFRGQRQYGVFISHDTSGFLAALDFVEDHGWQEAVAWGYGKIVDGVLKHVKSGKVIGTFVKEGSEFVLDLVDPDPIGEERVFRYPSRRGYPVTVYINEY